jgi:hypothetical protein
VHRQTIFPDRVLHEAATCQEFLRVQQLPRPKPKPKK